MHDSDVPDAEVSAGVTGASARRGPRMVDGTGVRRRRSLAVVLSPALLALVGVARASPPAPPNAPPAATDPARPEAEPRTPEQAADEVLTTVHANDAAALRSLATKDDPDPWLVADDLIRRSRPDVATAFATAAPRKDVERLPEYVASRRGRPDDGTARAAVGAAKATLDRGDGRATLEALGGATAEAGSITAIRATFLRAGAEHALARREEAAATYAAAGEAAERIGWHARAVLAFGFAGESCYERGAFERAILAFQRRLAIEEARGSRAGAGAALANVAASHRALGSASLALEFDERALVEFEASRDRALVAAAHARLGTDHAALGNAVKALQFHERALTEAQALGDRGVEVATLVSIGLDHAALGAYANAVMYEEKALEQAQALGDRTHVASALDGLGRVQSALGRYAKAIEYHERAIREYEALGDRAGGARSLAQVGIAEYSRGDHRRALAAYQRAMAEMDALGDRAGVAKTLGNIGTVQWSLGEHAEALDTFGRALAQKEALGDRAGAARTLVNIGLAYDSAGDTAKALASLERAARAARGLRSSPTLAFALTSSARVRLRTGDAGGALMTAERVLPVLEEMLGGLSDEEGAAVRAQYASAYAIGALAAVRLDDASSASTFLESGRAGSLLESLGARQGLRWAGVPDALLSLEAAARAAQAAASTAYVRALERGDDRERLRESRKAVDDANARLDEAVTRIQREARRASAVFYPRATPIEEIQASLPADTALVEYGLCEKEVVAVVATRREARVVALGSAEAVVSACEALSLDDARSDATSALGALKRALVEPLALPASVRRILVSPEGALCYVPFAAVLDDRDVAYVPSGTTYVTLEEEGRSRGVGVFALGDPDYGSARDPQAVEVYGGTGRGGMRRFAPLPGSRSEALAVGDVVTLGAEASETGFANAVGGRDRWRAVHLACHGVVDVERPALSALALSPDAQNDGFLTTLDVFRMKIPADLVVLSACETGKGRIVKGEGIVGLTRAFMFAGSPRVICSLWKVDDDATRALMVRFYELWSPKSGEPGLPTAAALRRAQEHVRSQPKWRHPFYWAAWVLWGLGS